MTHAFNAFQSLRPRAAAAPSAAYRQHTPGKPPCLLPGSPAYPRPASIHIETRDQAQASADKRAALSKRSI
mgnify:CR=1 FL=1